MKTEIKANRVIVIVDDCYHDLGSAHFSIESKLHYVKLLSPHTGIYYTKCITGVEFTITGNNLEVGWREDSFIVNTVRKFLLYMLNKINRIDSRIAETHQITRE